ncbi:hypothetical protein D6A01_24055 [Vibrio parahaemolyticus]|nr:hypothetical protein [Vibrio parahaemolyticus]OQU33449.1 hypothetical protein EN05_004495 [Vibrio parahaemolyticus]
MAFSLRSSIAKRRSHLNAALTVIGGIVTNLLGQIAEISPLFKWVFLIIALAPLLRVFVSHLTSKHTIRQKNLELLLSAYNSGKVNPCEKFVVENLISSFYKRSFSYPTIEALFKSNSPKRSFEIYRHVSRYVTLTEKKRPFHMKKKYATIRVFGFRLGYWVSVREFFYYVISSSTSMLIFGYVIRLLLNIPEGLEKRIILGLQVFILCLFAIVLLMLGYYFLKQQGKITEAKTFLKLQLTKRSRGILNARQF